MRYPITPDYLASAPDPLVRLYSDLEEKILEDICRRFKLSGEATESAIAQIKILRERGFSLEDIEKVIRDTLKLSEKELDEIFDRAVDRNKKYYDRMIEKAGIVSAEYKGLDQEIAAIRKQTHDDFVNLTRSLGFAIRTGAKAEFLPVAKTYQKILDDAAAQVLSGGMDYNTAIKAAVKRLTDSGLQMVDYASGWHNRVDVAARRAVMTGVSQLSAQYAEQTAEILETDLREVTAHMGARDTGTGWQNHKSWQGKVYSVSGTHPKYPSIYDVCGWGQVDGLEGANCRHHHFPFVEGVSTRTYTDEQLANIDPQPFEYQGKTYTAYEATQKQRQIETSMRKYKRDVIGYNAAGLTEDAQDAAIKLGRLSKEYKAFSKAAGLRTQPERAQVQNAMAQQAQPPATTEDAIRTANDLGVKYAQFEGMPLEQVNNAIDAVRTLPEDCVPKVIASGKDVSTVTGRPLGRKADQWWGVTYDYRAFSLRTMQLGYDATDFDGGLIVGLNTQKFKTLDALTKAKKAMNDAYFAKTGRYWSFNTDGKATAYHEIGHCFANVRGLPKGWEDASARWAEESASDLLKKPDEAFAEAWAAYHLGDKRLPDYISAIIRGLK